MGKQDDREETISLQNQQEVHHEEECTIGLFFLRGTTTVKNVMDLTLLCCLVEDPNLLVVRADSKYKTLKDLIEDARKNPEKVRASVGPVGDTEHVIVNRLEKASGVKFNVTSFVGTSYVPVLGGHTDFTFSPTADVQESVKAGKLRYLANAGDIRSRALPDEPTMKEQGECILQAVEGLPGPPRDARLCRQILGTGVRKALRSNRVQRPFEKTVDGDSLYGAGAIEKVYGRLRQGTCGRYQRPRGVCR
jgi:tripartite-type tricarboxylate transporter receptor subunit TctC